MKNMGSNEWCSELALLYTKTYATNVDSKKANETVAVL